jgi:hypothetical protein
MGFRFQRRISFGPGFRVNVSKSGFSTSVGRKGLWFTVGPRGTRTTAGIPGTGVSYTTSSRSRSGVGAVLLLALLPLLAFAMFG